ncbi:glycosyltransferase [Agromyces sp. Marseille-Q5079]|uniref:glycosyltransferase n=1 Tax=Agromyces sp. Marseille-Q5079 TaxID=3439059 RepID=UPI003D9CA456
MSLDPPRFTGSRFGVEHSRPRVSVCMATYNGAEYVREQIDSILDQLADGDELVIVDDASPDDTVTVLESLSDPRIRLTRSAVNAGYVRTFEAALARSTADVVLLADQDDVWMPGRVDAMLAALRESGALVVASNLVVLGTDEPLPSPITGRPWRLERSQSRQHRRNVLRIMLGDAPYFGCTMGVRREALPLLTPFPDFLTESHDLWIAIAANEARSIVHVEQPTLRRRVHESNASTPRPRGIRAALGSRWMLVRARAEARRRLRRA